MAILMFGSHLRLTFAEGACDKVPKKLRTFENFWQPNFPLVHRGIFRASLFDLNLHYTIF